MSRKDIKNDRQKTFCKKTSRHHCQPISLGGSDDDSNVSELTSDEHECWHRLYNNDTAEQIAQRTNRRYLDRAYVMVAIKRSVIEQGDAARIKLIAEKTLSEAKISE